MGIGRTPESLDKKTSAFLAFRSERDRTDPLSGDRWRAYGAQERERDRERGKKKERQTRKDDPLVDHSTTRVLNGADEGRINTAAIEHNLPKLGS